MKSVMDVDTSIFKAYDIRGIYPTQVNEDIVYKVGRAFCEIIKKENPGLIPDIVVGADMRLSSPSLKESLIKGLTDSGCNVIDVGLVTTPTFYFSVAYWGYTGGIQVSASHNPKEYNGLKMVRKGAVPFSGETGIEDIKNMVVAGNFPTPSPTGKVTQKEGVVEEEVKIQKENTNWDKIKPLKIVIDTGNGMGALDIEAIFKELPVSLIKLNFELDGTFPVHPPDPLKDENIQMLKEEVIKEKADLGIASDGDGDRYFLVDEKGESVPQPVLRGLMAQIELKNNPGATVCYDIRPGRVTKEMIEEAGGRAVVTRVGHSLIKETMIKEGAIFGGESSGHYFYKFDYGTFEAPVALILKFLAYLSESGKTVSQIAAPYKKYFHTGEVNSEVEDKEGKMKAIVEKYKDGQISYLDGVSVEYPDFWFNVRPSNTEPLLRFALEARTKEIMEQKRDEIVALIRS